MEGIRKRLFGYLADVSKDLEAQQQGDFNSRYLASKAPELPPSQVSWQALVEALVADRGGIREVDGVGLSSKRVGEYHAAIREFEEAIGVTQPGMVTIAQARAWFEQLQQTSGSFKTARKKLGCLSQLFAVAVEQRRLDHNPFDGLRIKTPKDHVTRGYQPFNRGELVQIYRHLGKDKDKERWWICLLLLATGARASEILNLRHKDIRTSEQGNLFIAFRHEPLDGYPLLLKSATSNERDTPIHQTLIKRGFKKLITPDKPGYIWKISRNVQGFSSWFNEQLVELGIYRFRETTVHSLRGTNKDLLREKGVPAEVHLALTGHAQKEVGDRAYGKGLRFMPDTTATSINQMDLSWLP